MIRAYWDTLYSIAGQYWKRIAKTLKSVIDAFIMTMIGLIKYHLSGSAVSTAHKDPDWNSNEGLDFQELANPIFALRTD